MTNDISKRITVPMIGLLMAGLIGLGHTQAGPAGGGQTSAPVSPVWKPDAALLKRLAPAVAVGDYTVRPPLGYRQQSREHDGFHDYRWVGATRADETAPVFALTIATPPPGMGGDAMSPQDALNGYLQAKQNTWQDYKQSPIETGLVSGRHFARAYYRGVIASATGSREMHGLAYATVDGSNIIVLTAQDAEGYYKRTLLLSEAAALTFR